MKNILCGKLFCVRNIKDIFRENTSKINGTPDYIMLGWIMLMFFKQGHNQSLYMLLLLILNISRIYSFWFFFFLSRSLYFFLN